MPSKLTNEMIEAAILGSEEQKRRIDVQIADLRAMLSGAPVSAPAEAEAATPTGRPRRKVSAAGRKAMALAQKKRWAAKKAAPEPSAKAATPAKKKNGMSPATKAKMIAKLKKYWADKRAAAKKSA
jgi:hypothetical protein